MKLGYLSKEMLNLHKPSHTNQAKYVNLSLTLCLKYKPHNYYERTEISIENSSRIKKIFGAENTHFGGGGNPKMEVNVIRFCW